MEVRPIKHSTLGRMVRGETVSPDEDYLRRYAELGRHAAQVLHDLDTPLTGITGYLSLIQQELQKMQEADGMDLSSMLELCDDIFEAVEYAAQMRQETMKFTKGEAQPIKADINSTIDQAIDIAEKKMGGIPVEREYDPNMPGIQIYEIGFLQTMVNLLVNASEAVNPDGGRIEVMTALNCEYAIIEVRDNGNGIGHTPPKENGNGLGLEYCRYVVGKHDGKICHESREGEGTTVRIKLPLDQQKEHEKMAHINDMCRGYVQGDV